jgi:hypothetical protein
VTLGAVDDVTHDFAVPPDHRAVDLGPDSGGQRRGIHQIREQNRQAPDLTMLRGGGQQLLGVEIAAVDGQHLPGECVGGGAVATIYRVDRAVEQLIDCRAGAQNPSQADDYFERIFGLRVPNGGRRAQADRCFVGRTDEVVVRQRDLELVRASR